MAHSMEPIKKKVKKRPNIYRVTWDDANVRFSDYTDEAGVRRDLKQVECTIKSVVVGFMIYSIEFPRTPSSRSWNSPEYLKSYPAFPPCNHNYVMGLMNRPHPY